MARSSQAIEQGNAKKLRTGLPTNNLVLLPVRSLLVILCRRQVSVACLRKFRDQEPTEFLVLFISFRSRMLRALSAPSTNGRGEEERDPTLAIRSDRPWVSSVSDGTFSIDFDLVLWIVSLSSIQSRRFCGWIRELRCSQMDWNRGWGFCVLRVCFLLSFSSFPRSVSIILPSGSQAIRLYGWDVLQLSVDPLSRAIHFLSCVLTIWYWDRVDVYVAEWKFPPFFPFEVHGITF